MNETQIAINRAVPLFKQAAELHEDIQAGLAKFREISGDLMDKAKRVGESLESAGLSLKASKLGIAFDEVLHAHAPNITPKQADKYRRFSKGELSSQQLCLLGFEVKQIEDAPAHEQRAKAAAWEQCWGYITKLNKVDYAGWPKEQIDMTKDELAAVVKKMGGEVRWG